MRKIPIIGLFAVLCVAAMGCDSDGASAPGTDVVTVEDSGATLPDEDIGESPGEDVVATADVPVAEDVPETPEYEACFGRTLVVEDHCAALSEGYNTDFLVDGEARAFYLHFPANVGAGGPWPVVFNWHGYGDSANNMARLLSDRPREDAYPFILVTPQGRGFFPPDGMEWDQLVVGEEANSEARLFDEVLECLNQRFRVDPDRVHTIGFSAGAIMSDLLGVLRGDCLASTAAFSGAYFSDPATVDILGSVSNMVSWPEMTTENTYPQLVAHGGTDDNYNLMVVTLQFDEAARNDADYLSDSGHDLVFCDHGLGHTVPYDFWGRELSVIVDFFRSHPRGAVSPFRTDGLPESYPSYCEFRPAE